MKERAIFNRNEKMNYVHLYDEDDKNSAEKSQADKKAFRAILPAQQIYNEMSTKLTGKPLKSIKLSNPKDLYVNNFFERTGYFHHSLYSKFTQSFEYGSTDLDDEFSYMWVNAYGIMCNNGLKGREDRKIRTLLLGQNFNITDLSKDAIIEATVQFRQIYRNISPENIMLMNFIVYSAAMLETFGLWFWKIWETLYADLTSKKRSDYLNHYITCGLASSSNIQFQRLVNDLSVDMGKDSNETHFSEYREKFTTRMNEILLDYLDPNVIDLTLESQYGREPEDVAETYEFMETEFNSNDEANDSENNQENSPTNSQENSPLSSPQNSRKKSKENVSKTASNLTGPKKTVSKPRYSAAHSDTFVKEQLEILEAIKKNTPIHGSKNVLEPKSEESIEDKDATLVFEPDSIENLYVDNKGKFLNDFIEQFNEPYDYLFDTGYIWLYVLHINSRDIKDNDLNKMIDFYDQNISFPNSLLTYEEMIDSGGFHHLKICIQN